MEEGNAIMMAFFRMELDAEDIIPVHRAGEFYAIISGGDAVLFIITNDVVRMQEIEPGLLVKSLHQGIPIRRADGVPSHVR